MTDHKTTEPTLTFGEGDYSCASCGLGMKEPCEHWKTFIANDQQATEGNPELTPASDALRDAIAKALPCNCLMGGKSCDEPHVPGCGVTYRPAVLAAIEPVILRDVEVARQALERSVLALDDWLNIYASEFCDESRVKEAYRRVRVQGTIAYIAEVQAENRDAIRQLGGSGK